jgi:hypothetical protein
MREKGDLFTKLAACRRPVVVGSALFGREKVFRSALDIDGIDGLTMGRFRGLDCSSDHLVLRFEN